MLPCRTTLHSSQSGPTQPCRYLSEPTSRRSFDVALSSAAFFMFFPGSVVPGKDKTQKEEENKGLFSKFRKSKKKSEQVLSKNGSGQKVTPGHPRAVLLTLPCHWSTTALFFGSFGNPYQHPDWLFASFKRRRRPARRLLPCWSAVPDRSAWPCPAPTRPPWAPLPWSMAIRRGERRCPQSWCPRATRRTLALGGGSTPSPARTWTAKW